MSSDVRMEDNVFLFRRDVMVFGDTTMTVVWIIQMNGIVQVNPRFDILDLCWKALRSDNLEPEGQGHAGTTFRV